MAEMKRSRVMRMDGRLINMVHHRGHLMVCSSGCCCGLVDRGYATVPQDLYHEEWERRKLRNRVHLTQSGCLGPCTMANTVLLVFDGHPIWFQSVNTEAQILAIFDYIDAMLSADGYVPPPPQLADYVFDFYTWTHQQGAALLRASASVAPMDADAPSLNGILLLTHKDTDLLTLASALDDLPVDFPSVDAINLMNVKNDAHMVDLLNDKGLDAGVIVVRVLGRLSSVPGFYHLLEHVRQYDQHLIVVSGTDSYEPELAAVSNVAAHVLHDVTAYFAAHGRANLTQMLCYLADHLLLYGFGYDLPQPQPEHGIYHPDLPPDATLADWQQHMKPDQPSAGFLFYRSHWLSGNTAFVDAMIAALEAQGMNALAIFTASLRQFYTRENVNGQVVAQFPTAFDFFLDEAGQPVVDVVISTLSYAMGGVNPDGPTLSSWAVEALAALDIPVLQAVTAGTSRWQWEGAARGLTPLDTAANVALPEFDGRIITVPISFKAPRPVAEAACEHCGPQENLPFEVSYYEPVPDRVAQVAAVAYRMAALRRKPNREKRIAFVLTNSTGKAQSIGNAVGLDAPASLMLILEAMQAAGYRVENLPPDGDTLIHTLIERCSYDEIFLTEQQLVQAAGHVPTGQYQTWFENLPATQQRGMVRQWGDAPGEAYVHEARISLAGLALGNMFVALQPPRGYGMDPNQIYHMPDLPPPHNYYALYRWLRDEWGADAIVHVGKHGTLEWLPGKGVGVSGECYPDTFLADLPLFYPFILNDPGEGAQAKRRTHAVIVDHLTPPMTTADGYGELAQLMQLVDEYYQVEMFDPSKLPIIQRQIWELMQQVNLEEDLALMMRRDHGDHVHEWDETMTEDGTPVTLAEMAGRDVAHLIEDMDGYLCELAGAQIRDGLHILGQMPAGEHLVDTLHALTRLPNLDVPSLRQAVAGAFALDLDAILNDQGAKLPRVPAALVHLADRPIVTAGDALQVIDDLARHTLALLAQTDFDATAIEACIAETFGSVPVPESMRQVLDFVCQTLVPALRQTTDEIDNLLHALEGGFVPAGPSGAPTRGMAHVLPTGRNFYAVDPRALPSMAAWEVGQGLAREVLDRHLTETGTYPENVSISMWGTSAMRTHGDDAAEVLALLGVRPVWQAENHRITGLALIPLEELGRPRIDVTVRISGFFRDAFPHLINLLDEAVNLVIDVDEPVEQNFVRKHYLADLADGREDARYRVFGSKPGTYGAGILPLIEERNWQDENDFAETYINWGGYAYTAKEQGVDARPTFAHRLAQVEVALHNQDNREHDIFDSDDYLQFHGGMIATIRALSGNQPKHYFGDTQNPALPKVRDLKEEALRVYRSRVVNPKWLDSITRHGYKGALEMAATVDYLFGYDATANVVSDFMYEQVAQQYALDEAMQQFFEQSNPWALRAISERLLEAAERGLWAEPNPDTLAALRATYLQAEAMLEGQAES